MTNLFLTNENFKKTIQGAKISQKQKDDLISKVPILSEEERMKLLNVLKEVTLLDFEETEAIEKVKKNWEEPEQQPTPQPEKSPADVGLDIDAAKKYLEKVYGPEKSSLNKIDSAYGKEAEKQ